MVQGKALGDHLEDHLRDEGQVDQHVQPGQHLIAGRAQLAAIGVGHLLRGTHHDQPKHRALKLRVQVDSIATSILLLTITGSHSTS